MIVHSPPEPRDVSPAVSTQQVERKRKRKAISCYACRRRKLKCDREQPACSRCRKAGLADACTYEADLVQQNGLIEEILFPSSVDPNRGLKESGLQQSRRGDRDSEKLGSDKRPPRSGQAERISQLERRLSSLESGRPAATWQNSGQSASAPKASVEESEPPAFSFPRVVIERESMIFRGAHFATQYYGGSNPTSIVTHFPELRTFMKEAIRQHSSLPRVQRDLKAAREKWKLEKSQTLLNEESSLHVLLPSQEIVDHLVQLYIESFETVYHVLHLPSFWKEYHGFWINPQAGNPAFVATVLLMISTASCTSLKEAPTYVGDSSVARETAVVWVEACEVWLRHQTNKHVFLAIWQVRCLLVIAKQANSVKKKEAWTNAGNLIRQVMSAGFHREPSILGQKVSIFNQELRRRLWATAAELDLQASIEKGLPPAIVGLSSDTSRVLNVHDEDLKEDCSRPPLEKAKDEYTTSSYLHLSNQSFSLRVSLNTMLNELSPHPQYGEVLSLDEKINQRLKELPFYHHPQPGQLSSNVAVLPLALLEIQLRQFLLLLHGPYARKSEVNVRYSLSKMTCFDAASRILQLQSELIKDGNYMLCLFRNDIFRAAFSICHNVYVTNTLRSDVLIKSMNASFLASVEKALNMLEERITQHGTGYTHYWYISAAYGLLESTISPENGNAYRHQAVDRVARQYYKVLASQTDMARAKQKLLLNRIPRVKQTNSGASPNELMDMTIPNAGVSNGSTLQDLTPNLEEFYFGDPAAWTFDNLWPYDQLDLSDVPFTT